MRIHQLDRTTPKSWFEGPWNPDLNIAVGYARQGINEPHFHRTVTKFYLIAAGSAVVWVEKQQITLYAGEMLIIEPGEAHTFLSISPDYLHFVIHTPGLPGEAAHSDNVSVGL